MHTRIVQFDIPHEESREEQEKRVRKIVKAINSGDVQQFDEIFNIYQNLVFALAWKITGNYDDSMDVVQECFIRAFRALGCWKGKARFYTWLHRIAVNTAIDYIRKETKHKRQRITASDKENSEQEIKKLMEGVSPKTPLTEMKRKDLRRQLFCAINSLKGKQKQCFILRYFADLPIKKVASVAGCGEGTAKRHLFRARKRLKAILGEQD